MKRLLGGVRKVWTYAITKQWIASVFGFAVVTGASAFLLAAQPAYAATATSAKWVNREYLVDNNGHNYKDSNTWDYNHQYIEETAEDCPDKIKFEDTANRPTDGNSDDPFFYQKSIYDGSFFRPVLIISTPGTRSAGGALICNDTNAASFTVDASTNDNRRITWWKSEDNKTITNILTGIVFSKSADFKGVPRYYRDSEAADVNNNCADMILLHAANPMSTGELYFGRGDVAGSSILFSVEANSDFARESESYDLDSEPNKIGPKTCYVRSDSLNFKKTGEYSAYADGDNSGDQPFLASGLDDSGNTHPSGDFEDDAFITFIGTVNNLPKDSTGQPQSGPSNPGGSNPDKQDQTVCRGGALGWIICPIIQAIEKLSKLLQDAMQYFLTVNPLPIGTGQMYDTWNNIRNFANIAFVLAFFAIIFSQATSIGISNYGIKRLLPRLIAIAIATNISYYLCSFAIDVFNILGVGVTNLFGILNGGSAGEFRVDNAAGAVMGGAIVTALAWAFATGAIVEIFPLIVVGIIALLVMFLALAIRQAIIILLVVFSPLAFVAGLLPGTQQWFNRWTSMFLSLLALYPIIMAIFAGTRLATSILSAVGG